MALQRIHLLFLQAKHSCSIHFRIKHFSRIKLLQSHSFGSCFLFMLLKLNLNSLLLIHSIRLCGWSFLFKSVTSASCNAAGNNKGLFYSGVCAVYLPSHLCSDRSYYGRPSLPWEDSFRPQQWRLLQPKSDRTAEERATRPLFVPSSALFWEGQSSEVSL